MKSVNEDELVLWQSKSPAANVSPSFARSRSRAGLHLVLIATESGSMDVADRFIESLTRHFLLLAISPYMGRRRDEDLRPSMRSFTVGKYLILYRIDGEEVLILHVVRGSRDIETLFGL